MTSIRADYGISEHSLTLQANKHAACVKAALSHLISAESAYLNSFAETLLENAEPTALAGTVFLRDQLRQWIAGFGLTLPCCHQCRYPNVTVAVIASADSQ